MNSPLQTLASLKTGHYRAAWRWKAPLPRLKLGGFHTRKRRGSRAHNALGMTMGARRVPHLRCSWRFGFAYPALTRWA